MVNGAVSRQIRLRSSFQKTGHMPTFRSRSGLYGEFATMNQQNIPVRQTIAGADPGKKV